jgi:hypothetical protein
VSKKFEYSYDDDEVKDDIQELNKQIIEDKMKKIDEMDFDIDININDNENTIEDEYTWHCMDYKQNEDQLKEVVDKFINFEI